MPNEELQKLNILEISLLALEQSLRDHDHDGVLYKQVKSSNLFGSTPVQISLATGTIATTGNTDGYILAPFAGVLVSVDFSGVDALAASDTNYITFTITNLGQAGSGSTALLATAPAGINTTKVTGGTAISANTKYAFRIDAVTINATRVQEGDRLRIRAAVTGTLANTVTFPTFILRFI